MTDIRLEAKCRVEGNRIHGIAALPRFSRNGRVYPPDELAKLDGKSIPVLWQHQGTPEKVGDPIADGMIIGRATVYWDSSFQQLTFEGNLKQQYSWIPSYFPQLGVSIGAHYKNNHFCIKAGKCYDMATDLILEEISLVIDAGMPETTVNVIDSEVKQCGECQVTPLERTLESLDPTSRIKLEWHLRRAHQSLA